MKDNLLSKIKMIKPVLVDENTRWECQHSGKCCHKLGCEMHEKLFAQPPKEDGRCVKLNEKNLCNIYNERPIGCQMYPFYPNGEKLKQGSVEFTIGTLTIDSECPDYGKGPLVMNNK